jgi:hypothetical protein
MRTVPTVLYSAAMLLIMLAVIDYSVYAAGMTRPLTEFELFELAFALVSGLGLLAAGSVIEYLLRRKL